MSDRVMHIDMDAFFASIEQQVNPALRGKPVVVGGRNNKYRSIICAASYEAKALGINSTMPSWKAFRICPEVVFVPADTAKYLYTSEEIFYLLEEFSPRVEAYSVDEFFVDIMHCERFFKSEKEMGQKIKERIKERFGITCSVGIAPTRITAKLAAKLGKPDGLVSLDYAKAKEVLKSLSVEKICGIGPRLKRRFSSLGIETCGQLAEYPDAVLKEHFGVVGLWLKSSCLIEDTVSCSYFQKAPDTPKSVGHSQTLKRACADQEYIKNWMYLLSEMIAGRLRHLQRQGRTIFFYFSSDFHQGCARQKTFQEPTYDGYEIYQRVLKVLQEMNVNELIVRVLGINVSNLCEANNRYLFQRQKKRERLLQEIDHINDRFGSWTICPAALKNAEH